MKNSLNSGKTLQTDKGMPKKGVTVNWPGNMCFRKWLGVCVLADYTHNSSNAMFCTKKGCIAELCFQKKKETAL